MTQVKKTEQRAKLSFNDQGFPYSDQFDDIYFDDSHGYQQSQEVFLQGNNLPNAWHNCEHKCFVIGETGFGTGLNFFLTLKAFLDTEHLSEGLSLHFISVEKFPLITSEIVKSLAHWPELSPLVNELVAQYPKKLTGTHQLYFANKKVTLSLIFDDAINGFKQLRNTQIDAWFLDGFAPQKNPEMWQPALFQQLARLSKANTSIATFTVAGFVRRGLEDVGFRLQKQKSGGKKEQILVGWYLGDKYHKPKQGFKIREKTSKPQHVTIIGGGLASACAAYFLAKQKIKVTLLCKHEQLATAASSNAIGAVYPLIHQKRDAISDFYALAFEKAVALYKSLHSEGYQFSHDFSGLIEVAYKEALQQRLSKFSQNSPWPKTLVSALGQKQASAQANIDLPHGGLFFPNAGWVCPPELVTALFEHAEKSGFCDIKYGINISEIARQSDNRWLLTGNNTKHNKAISHKAKVIVVCPGAEGINLPALQSLPLSAVRGQVTEMAAKRELAGLKTVICHKGYLTPQNNDRHCIGATFDKDDVATDVRTEDNKFNLDMLTACLPELNHWQSSDILGANAQLRCCTPDHLPIVGQLPNIEQHQSIYWKLSKDKNLAYKEIAPVESGLFVLTGLGARGLCSAPLLAEILAAEICNKHYPVDNDMLFNLAPNRFVIRDIVRSKS